MADAAKHLAAFRLHFFARLLFQILTERIVGGDQEPALAALREHAARDAVAHRPGVVGPVHGVRRAFGAGQQRAAGAGADQHLVLLARDVGDSEGHRGIRQVDDHVDAVHVEPAARDRRSDIGLVLMISGEDLDLALRLFGEILGGELRRHHRPRSLEVGIDARHVVHHADAQRAVHLGSGRRAKQGKQGGYDGCVRTHAILP